MPYVPEFKGPIEGYTVNYLTKNHWKIARTVPREDAMQEAYCVFLKCRRRYAEVEEPRHFMALYKTAWHNRFTDMANEDTEGRCCQPLAWLDGRGDDESGGADAESLVGAVDNDGFLAVMIHQAPREVAMVLSLFLNAPQELLDAALLGWRAGGDRRFKAGGSGQINKLLGFDPDYDCMAAVAEYFSPTK